MTAAWIDNPKNKAIACGSVLAIATVICGIVLIPKMFADDNENEQVIDHTQHQHGLTDNDLQKYEAAAAVIGVNLDDAEEVKVLRDFEELAKKDPKVLEKLKKETVSVLQEKVTLRKQGEECAEKAEKLEEVASSENIKALCELAGMLKGKNLKFRGKTDAIFDKLPQMTQMTIDPDQMTSDKADCKGQGSVDDKGVQQGTKNKSKVPAKPANTTDSKGKKSETTSGTTKATVTESKKVANTAKVADNESKVKPAVVSKTDATSNGAADDVKQEPKPTVDSVKAPTTLPQPTSDVQASSSAVPPKVNTEIPLTAAPLITPEPAELQVPDQSKASLTAEPVEVETTATETVTIGPVEVQAPATVEPQNISIPQPKTEDESQDELVASPIIAAVQDATLMSFDIDPIDISSSESDEEAASPVVANSLALVIFEAEEEETVDLVPLLDDEELAQMPSTDDEQAKDKISTTGRILEAVSSTAASGLDYVKMPLQYAWKNTGGRLWDMLQGNAVRKENEEVVTEVEPIAESNPLEEKTVIITDVISDDSSTPSDNEGKMITVVKVVNKKASTASSYSDDAEGKRKVKKLKGKSKKGGKVREPVTMSSSEECKVCDDANKQVLVYVMPDAQRELIDSANAAYLKREKERKSQASKKSHHKASSK